MLIYILGNFFSKAKGREGGGGGDGPHSPLVVPSLPPSDFFLKKCFPQTIQSQVSERERESTTSPIVVHGVYKIAIELKRKDVKTIYK